MKTRQGDLPIVERPPYSVVREDFSKDVTVKLRDQ